MCPLFQPFTDDDRHRRVCAACNDMRAFIGILRLAYGYNLYSIFFADLFGVFLAMRPGWAGDLYLFDFSRQEKGFDMRACHPSRADHTDDFGVYPRHVLNADP